MLWEHLKDPLSIKGDKGKFLSAVLLDSRLRLHFLNPVLAELLIKDDSPWVIDLIPDHRKRESVQKVHEASKQEEELTTALDGRTIVNKPSNTHPRILLPPLRLNLATSLIAPPLEF